MNEKGGSGCTYELRRRPRPAGTDGIFVTYERTPGPPNVHTPPSQASANVPLNARTSPPGNLPPITWSDSSESSLPLSPSLQGPSSGASVIQEAYDITKSIPRPTAPFTVLPSIHLHSIPRPFRTPFSLIPPERVQVSGVSESDLDMKLCVFSRFPKLSRLAGTEAQFVSRLRSLCRMNKLGLYFRKEKLEAILRGDTSNAVVHRLFVYTLRGVGKYLCETPEATPAMVRLQARHTQEALESLVEISRTGDHKLNAQALLLLAYISIIVGFPRTAQLYLSRACEMINKANLRFLPVYGRPAELSEQVREDAAALSQTMYLENYFYLTLEGSAPTKTARIEKEFRLELQVSHLTIFHCRPRNVFSGPV